MPIVPSSLYIGNKYISLRLWIQAPVGEKLSSCKQIICTLHTSLGAYIETTQLSTLKLFKINYSSSFPIALLLCSTVNVNCEVAISTDLLDTSTPFVRLFPHFIFVKIHSSGISSFTKRLWQCFLSIKDMGFSCPLL